LLGILSEIKSRFVSIIYLTLLSLFVPQIVKPEHIIKPTLGSLATEDKENEDEEDEEDEDCYYRNRLLRLDTGSSSLVNDKENQERESTSSRDVIHTKDAVDDLEVTGDEHCDDTSCDEYFESEQYASIDFEQGQLYDNGEEEDDSRTSGSLSCEILFTLEDKPPKTPYTSNFDISEEIIVFEREDYYNGDDENDKHRSDENSPLWEDDSHDSYVNDDNGSHKEKYNTIPPRSKTTAFVVENLGKGIIIAGDCNTRLVRPDYREYNEKYISNVQSIEMERVVGKKGFPLVLLNACHEDSQEDDESTASASERVVEENHNEENTTQDYTFATASVDSGDHTYSTITTLDELEQQVCISFDSYNDNDEDDDDDDGYTTSYTSLDEIERARSPNEEGGSNNQTKFRRLTNRDATSRDHSNDTTIFNDCNDDDAAENVTLDSIIMSLASEIDSLFDNDDMEQDNDTVIFDELDSSTKDGPECDMVSHSPSQDDAAEDYDDYNVHKPKHKGKTLAASAVMGTIMSLLSASRGSSDDDDDPTTETSSTQHTRSDLLLIVPPTGGPPRTVPGECVICLEAYKPGEIVVWSSAPQSTCQHVYHRDCITNYLIRVEGGTCPCCRQAFI
jgi:Ring finger domain